MDTIEGVTYFRKPYEYGVLGPDAKYGVLQIDSDKLVVVAHTRKKLGIIEQAKDQALGLAGDLVGRAVESTKPRTEFRLEISKSTIKEIQPVPAGFGLSYNVHTQDGTDQLDVLPAHKQALLEALARNGYPVSKAVHPSIVIAVVAVILILIFLLQ